MKHDQTQLNLRIPKEIKDFLANEAKKDDRSLNSFILHVFKKLKEQNSNSGANVLNQQA